MGKFTYDINRYEPKQMVALPAGLFIISVLFLAFNFFTTGMPIEPGIDFAGGISVTVFSDDSKEDIESYFSGYPLQSIGESINNGYYIVFQNMGDDEFRDLTDHVILKYPEAKIDQIGETFGKTLQEQALWAILISFVLSVAVVISAISDIIITAAIMDVVGITLSLGTTAALLMLIGYSVDSDILLTTRLLKRKGKLEEKMYGAFRTGIIMTSTTFTAVFAMFVVSAVGNVVIIRDISAVLLIGLAVDVMNTWMLNAGLLKWYMTRGGRK